jgi:ketosteroid isomerase-like protein
MMSNQESAPNVWATTGAQHGNVAVLQAAFQAYQNGSLDAMQDMFAEDVVVHISGLPDSPFTGDHLGKEGLRDIFSLAKENQEEERWDVDGYTANDDYCVILCRISGKRQGRSGKIPVAQVFRMKPDGKCSEAWFLMGAEHHQPSQVYWAGVSAPVR